MNFVLTHPDDLPFEALNYLSKAIEKTPGNDSNLWQILDKARRNEGSIILIKSEKILGALYLEVYPNILNVVLLSGDHVNDWKEGLTDYLLNLMKERGIGNVCVIGRQGWNKIFTRLKPVGMLYVLGGELTRHN